jgi:hypothetical protein
MKVHTLNLFDSFKNISGWGSLTSKVKFSENFIILENNIHLKFQT